MMLTADQRRAYIETIRSLPNQLDELLTGLTIAQLTTQYLPDEWTAAQNVHHLADSHMNSVVRLKLMLTEEHPTFKPYDQDAWATLPDNDLPIEHSMLILRGLHRRWVAVFESLRDADWERTGLHPDNGVLTVDDQLRTYAAHCEAHLDQISRTLAAQY